MAREGLNEMIQHRRCSEAEEDRYCPTVRLLRYGSSDQTLCLQVKVLEEGALKLDPCDSSQRLFNSLLALPPLRQRTGPPCHSNVRNARPFTAEAAYSSLCESEEERPKNFPWIYSKTGENNLFPSLKTTTNRLKTPLSVIMLVPFTRLKIHI